MLVCDRGYKKPESTLGSVSRRDLLSGVNSSHFIERAEGVVCFDLSGTHCKTTA